MRIGFVRVCEEVGGQIYELRCRCKWEVMFMSMFAVMGGQEGGGNGRGRKEGRDLHRLGCRDLE